jgi:hypothetical protein
MTNFKKSLLFLAVAAAIGTLATAIKLNHLRTGLVSSGKTQLELNVTVRGTGGRAVKNANISIYDPEQIHVGKTNDSGFLSKKIQLSSGRSLILQADGIAFKMQRTILIPRSLEYRSSVFFDLAEVHEGNATLLSTENAETTSLVKTPPPVPPTLIFEAINSKIAETTKTQLDKYLNNAAAGLGLAAASQLKCSSWSDAPNLHECFLVVANSETRNRLVTTLPNDESTATTWLKEFLSTENNVYPKKIGKGEILVTVRHNKRKFRLYLWDKPLSVWKERKKSHVFRITADKRVKDSDIPQLTLVTDSGELLQRKITFPSRKRNFFLTVPKSEILNLSKRD